MKNILALLFALLLMLSFQQNSDLSKYESACKQADSCRMAGTKIFSDKTYKDTYKRNSEARATYQKGIDFTPEFLKDTNLHFMRLRLQHNIGSTYLEQNNYEAALDYYNIINENLSTYKDKLDSMPLYTRLRFVNTLETARTYMMMSELEMAKLFFEEADNIVLKNLSQLPEDRLIIFYRDFAALLRRKNDYKQAEEFAHKGLSLLSDSRLEALKAAINTAKKALDDTTKTLIKAHVVVTDSTEELSLFKKQWADAQIALSNAEIFKADLYMNLANTLHDWDKYDEAEKYFLQALSFYKGKNTTNAIRCFMNLGESYRKNNKLQAADRVLSEQINTLNKTNANANGIYDLDDIIGLYTNRGETQYDGKQYKKANADYQKALEWLRFKPNTEGVLPPIDSFNGNRFYLLMVLNDIALVHIKQKEQDKALAIYDVVEQLINSIRRDYVGEEDKMGVSGKTRGIMEKAVNVCMALFAQYGSIKYLEQAFYFSEQSKAMTLLENAKLNGATALSGVDNEKIAKIRYDINEIEKKMATGSANTADVTNLRQLYTDKRSLLKRTKQSNYNTDKLATIHQVQANLSDNQALVEYFIEKEEAHRLHTFVIQKDKPIVHKVAVIDTSFEQHIDSMATYLSQSHNRNEKSYCQHAYALYSILIQPIILSDSDGKESLPHRMIIIPEYPLSKIPFAALITQPNLTSYEDVVAANAFWDKAITYNYSANLHDYMMKSRQNEAKKTETMVTVAPSFSYTQGSLSPTLNEPIELEPISEKYNEQEADAISHIIKTSNYHNEKATKDNLMATFKDSTNTVIHISTHGILMKNPKLSFISMTQKMPQLNTAELIFLSDLYNNRYLKNLNLVFLSACETGISNGETYKGEGMLSMSWGLASAGVKSFVTTLWSVNAQQTSILTPLFYKAMANDPSLPKDIALSNAQKKYLADNPEKANPYHWAGFVLVGNTEGLIFEKPTTAFSGFTMAIASGFVVLLGWFFYKRQKNS